MAKPLLPTRVWQACQRVLPQHEPSPRGGQPRKPDRLCLTGLLFVLKSGIAWEDFPCEMGCCGMTLHNRLQEWCRAGVWPRLHQILLARLRHADRIDFSRVVVDAAFVRATHGGKKRGRAPSTAASPAPSTTGRSRPAARRWPGR